LTRSRIRFTTCIAAALLVVAVAAPPLAAAVSPDWAAKWREDLTFIETELPGAHANLFHTMPRDSFAARIEGLRRAVPEMDHHQITVAIAELIADVRDGHTRLTLPVDPGAAFFSGHSSTPDPHIDGLRFHHLPIRLCLYDDGLFVRRVGRKHAAAAGARVLRIGRMSADEAIRAVTPVVQRDNDTQVRHLLPDFLVVPEVLHARGVTANPAAAAFEVETAAGKKMTLALGAVPLGGTVEWADARDTAKPLPLYLRDPESNYWFEYLADDRIVYMQYNEVYDREDESLDAFTDRLISFIDANPVEALVLDIRGNPGGNNARNRPLLRGLIGCAELAEPGRLFVIAGRGTFSAAMMLAVDLEKLTNTIFVGEPTGASPNGYGDSRKIRLPHSGLTIRASTLHWQYSDPRDDRPSIEPHVPARLTAADYRANRDPALEAVRTMVAGPPQAPVLRGPLEGFIHSGRSSYAFKLVFDDAGKSATIRVPDFGLDPTPVTNLRHDAARLAFDVPISSGTMHIEGRWLGGWLVGNVSVPSNGVHMVLIPPW
jgi:hypothetical protein